MATPTAQGQLKSSTSHDPLLMACRDAYKISNEAYEDCILEGQEVIDLYHNRQYTSAQLAKLFEQGSPPETFNVIKMMANAMIGYMDTILSTINIEPRYRSSAATALLMNDVVSYILDDNDFDTMNKKVKLDGILTGLMVIYEEVIPTGKYDDYGREVNEIKLSHIPSWQVRTDPMSRLDNYEDAKFVHHFKWIREAELIEMFGAKKIKGLTEYYNFLDGDPQADYDREYTSGQEEGRYKSYNNYLIIKTIIKHKGKTWSVIWNDEYILEKQDISDNEVWNPYRVTKMSDSDISEYYGPFRDITETQKAINQALIQIQLLVNTSKAFVEDNAVDNMEEFKELFNRVNSVIPVLDLQGIRVEDMSRDVASQYAIIDQALIRIKAVLGINDSFLGQSFASDSGRKVAMQTQSSASQLTTVTDRVKFMFKMVGEDIVKNVKQFYQAEQIFTIAEPLNAKHYIEVNKAIKMPTGEVTQEGDMVTSLVWVEDEGKDGKPKQDKDGAYLMRPLTEADTTLEFADVKLKIVVTNAHNADERNQLLMETFVNGPAGQIVMQTNPAGYLRTLAMQVSEFGTKHSLEIARLLMETALGIEEGKIDPRLAMVGGDLQAIMGASMGGNNGAGGQAGGTMPSQGSQAPQAGSKGPQSPTLGLPNATQSQGGQ